MAAPGMPVVKIYYHRPMLPDVSRVLACLYEKDINDFELIDMNNSESVPGYLPKLQASAKAPVHFYDDEATVLHDSRSICRYLTEKYKDRGNRDLLGRDVLERPTIEQWLKSEEQIFDPPSRTMVLHLAFPTHDHGFDRDESVMKESQRLADVLDMYDQLLGERKYLAGNYFTLADLSHMPNSYYLSKSDECCHLYNDRANVRRWWRDVSHRPSWTKVVERMQDRVKTKPPTRRDVYSGRRGQKLSGDAPTKKSTSRSPQTDKSARDSLTSNLEEATNEPALKLSSTGTDSFDVQNGKASVVRNDGTQSTAARYATQVASNAAEEKTKGDQIPEQSDGEKGSTNFTAPRSAVSLPSRSAAVPQTAQTSDGKKSPTTEDDAGRRAAQLRQWRKDVDQKEKTQETRTVQINPVASPAVKQNDVYPKPMQPLSSDTNGNSSPISDPKNESEAQERRANSGRRSPSESNTKPKNADERVTKSPTSDGANLQAKVLSQPSVSQATVQAQPASQTAAKEIPIHRVGSLSQFPSNTGSRNSEAMSPVQPQSGNPKDAAKKNPPQKNIGDALTSKSFGPASAQTGATDTSTESAEKAPPLLAPPSTAQTAPPRKSSSNPQANNPDQQ